MWLTNRENALFMSYDPRFKNEENQTHYVMIFEDKRRQQEILEKIEIAVNFKNNLQQK